MWFDRCALEAGLVTAPALAHAQLPPGVEELARAQRVSPHAAARLYVGFCLALRVRSLRDPGDSAFLFSADFAGPWSGISSAQARKARVALSQAGAIQEVGRYGVGASGREAKLWALGPGVTP